MHHILRDNKITRVNCLPALPCARANSMRKYLCILRTRALGLRSGAAAALVAKQQPQRHLAMATCGHRTAHGHVVCMLLARYPLEWCTGKHRNDSRPACFRFASCVGSKHFQKSPVIIIIFVMACANENRAGLSTTYCWPWCGWWPILA